jgi:N-acetylneuraminic acid mutarotase
VRPLLAVVALASLVACSGDSGSRAPVATASDVSWSNGPSLPTPRTEVAVASLRSDLFAAGGFDADGEATDVLERYSGSTERWMAGPALPEALHHAGLAGDGTRLYVVGGYRSDGRPSAKMWSLAPQRDGRWRAEPDMPSARGALAVAIVDGLIHAVGGASSFGGDPRLSEAHESYDPRTRAWERLEDLPEARDHLAATALDGKLYVVGGRKLSLTTNLARMDVWDGSRWSRAPDMPTARGGLAAAATRGRVFVFGGEQPRGTFPHAEVYDLAADGWSRAPDLPTARHGLGAAAIGGRIYVVGGGPQPGLSVSGANEILVVK